MIIWFILLACLILIPIAYFLGRKIGEKKKDEEWVEKLPQQRKEAIAKSRAVLSGQFSEQLAPFLPRFDYAPTECKFIGKPIDFLVFKGLDEKDISEVVFVEVKSGESRLSPVEKNLKKAIEEKRVSWKEYRIPKEVTEKRKE